MFLSSLGDYLEKITFGNPYKASNDDNQTQSAAAKEKSHRTRRGGKLLF